MSVLQQAVALHQKGRLVEAATLYRQVLSKNPQQADALHLLGVVELQTNNAAAAVELISRAIKLQPRNAAFHANLGFALEKLRRLDDAIASYDRALEIKPDADQFYRRGNILHQLKRFADSLDSYDRALSLKPNYVEALNNRGNALRNLKRFDDALASYARALAIKPDHAEALNNRGIALRNLRRFDEAIASYDRALAHKPDYAQAFNNRGNALWELKRFEEALDSYDRALAIDPEYSEALYNRGMALRELARLEDALASFDHALALRPDYVQALVNKGTTLQDLKRFDEALASFDRALALKPDYVEALNSRGTLLASLGQPDAAETQFQQAVLISPDYADAQINLGLARVEQGRLEQAIVAAEAAVKLSNQISFPHYRLGTLWARCGRNEDARTQFEMCLAGDPEDKQGARMFLARLGFESLPERAPNALLKRAYAKRAAWWDQGLTQANPYQGAELVAQAFNKLVGDRDDLRVLDAGCGTGSVGQLIGRRVNRLEGVDLSPEMLAQAKKKAIYQSLYEDDLVAFLAHHAECYDVVTSAATLIHFSDLRPVLEACAIALRDAGLFIFTLFPNEQDDNSVSVGSAEGLAQGGCYMHGRRYVARVAADTRFEVEVLKDAVHEYNQRGEPMAGLVVALRRHSRDRPPAS